MINLAGSNDTDAIMSDELEIAGIACFTGIVNPYGEVNSTTVGLLGFNSEEGGFDSRCIDMFTRTKTRIDFLEKHASFVFTRAWYYYVVNGFVPEDVAWEIYNNKHSKDIRVAGHCGCVEPVSPWLTEHKIAGKHCVDQYHIDSQIGLNTFVKIITKNGLV